MNHFAQFIGLSNNKYFLLTVLCFLLFNIGCTYEPKDIEKMASKAQRKSINEKYSKIPTEEILQQVNGNTLYTELQNRYKHSLTQFKSETENDCTKIVVVIITPEVGKSLSLANTYGIPFIVETCSALNIDCIDLTPSIATKEPSDITLIPDDNHWSKQGSEYIADLLTELIVKYSKYRNTNTFKDSLRPKIFGDLPPNTNEVVDGERNLPYHQKVNAQGLRMNHNLSFPKKKQTILFIGDAQIYSPYLDNEFIATSLLQQRFPDKEILNAGNVGYTIEDYLSLYMDKAKYAEPDVVFVCTNGNNILDYFFTQRNHYSRLVKAFPPTNLEKTFYNELYNTNVN